MVADWTEFLLQCAARFQSPPAPQSAAAAQQCAPVDDLPKTDKVYLDLKFFEKNFKGIMPLEIMVDTKKRRGVKRKGLSIFNRIDSLSMYIASQKEMNRPLNVSEGLKFATQAFYDNDSMSYRMPSNEEGAIINDLIVASKGEGNKNSTSLLNIKNSLLIIFSYHLRGILTLNLFL